MHTAAGLRPGCPHCQELVLGSGAHETRKSHAVLCPAVQTARAASADPLSRGDHWPNSGSWEVLFTAHVPCHGGRCFRPDPASLCTRCNYQHRACPLPGELGFCGCSSNKKEKGPPNKANNTQGGHHVNDFDGSCHFLIYTFYGHVDRTLAKCHEEQQDRGHLFSFFQPPTPPPLKPILTPCARQGAVISCGASRKPNGCAAHRTMSRSAGHARADPCTRRPSEA